MTECGLKHYWVLRLDKALYKDREWQKMRGLNTDEKDYSWKRRYTGRLGEKCKITGNTGTMGDPERKAENA